MKDKTTESAQYLATPLSNYHWLKKGAFDYLHKKKVFDQQPPMDYLSYYDNTFERLLPVVAPLIRNELDRGNVYFVLLVVCLYELLRAKGFSTNDALTLTEESITIPTREFITENTRIQLDRAEDPHATLVEASKEREANYFGDSFEFERSVDNEYAYVLHIKKCLFYETLRRLDRTELQYLLCAMDLGWINGIDPDRHAVQFIRPVTFATGKTCQMWFVKKEKL